jgi:spore coat polysaccharide biosynthesis protein SpsF
MGLKVVAAIQARLDSQRLPRKALLPIVGRPMLAHVIERVKAVPGLDQVVLTTSDLPSDTELASLAAEMAIGWSCGSTDDVIGRLHRVARDTQADLLVRVWGDCPCVDPSVIQAGIDAMLETGVDYLKIHSNANNAIGSEISAGMYPYGLNFQIYRRPLLDMIQSVHDPFIREFPQKYILRHAGEWQIQTLASEADYSDIGLTVDYMQDLQFIREIFQALYQPGRVFDYRQVAEFVRNGR